MVKYIKYIKIIQYSRDEGRRLSLEKQRRGHKIKERKMDIHNQSSGLGRIGCLLCLKIPKDLTESNPYILSILKTFDRRSTSKRWSRRRKENLVYESIFQETSPSRRDAHHHQNQWNCTCFSLGASFCITWNKHNFESYIILYIELNGNGDDDEDAALLMIPRAQGKGWKTRRKLCRFLRRLRVISV